MEGLSDIGTIRALLQKNGFSFRKELGQNFLISPDVCPQMAAACGVDKDSGVIEIGAGIGVLTHALSQRAGKVVSFEVDRKLMPILSQTLADCENVVVLHEDILKSDLDAVIRDQFGQMRVCVCANLPYYITTPILTYLLERRFPLDSITVMVQKEAAQRLCATVGSRLSGAITVAVHYYAEPQTLFEVPRECFLPAPKVDSTVIRLRVRSSPPVETMDETFFFRVVKAAFAQRRKTALNSISAGLGLPRETVAAALTAAGLDPNARAETFTMDHFAAIGNILFQNEQKG